MPRPPAPRARRGAGEGRPPAGAGSPLVVASPGAARRALSPGMKAASAAQPLPGKIAARLREAKWLALVAVAAYLALILGTFNRADPGWSHSAAVERIYNAGGHAGAWLADLLLYLFGVLCVVVGRPARIRRDLGLSPARRLVDLRQAAVHHRARRLLDAARGVLRHRGAALPFDPGEPAARAGRTLRRRDRPGVPRHLRLHRCDAPAARDGRDRAVPLHRHLLGRADGGDRPRLRGRLVQDHRALAAARGPQGGRDRRGEAGDRRRGREEAGGGPRADPDRSAGTRDTEVGARDQGEAGAAVPGPARHAAPAARAPRRGAARSGTDERRDARVHVAADREEAEGLRRRGEGARRLSGTGHHPLRDRAGRRREGQPGRQPGEGSRACALGRVDPGGRDDSRQVVHGARDPEPEAPDGAAHRDPRLEGLPRPALAAHARARQGHRRPPGGGGPRADAASARRRHDRLRQVGRDERDDPVAPLQGRAARRPDRDGRPEDARALGLPGHPPSACAGRHRHEAGGRRADVVHRRDGAALQADVLAGRAEPLRVQSQDRRRREARREARGSEHRRHRQRRCRSSACRTSWWSSTSSPT